MDKITDKLSKLSIKDNDNKKIDIMDIICIEDKELLMNKRILNMSKIDWGKTISISNQYIQRNILRYFLKQHKIKVYTTDDDKFEKYKNKYKIKTNSNSSGFDLIIINKNKKIFRIQSKLRQVEGKTDYSRQIYIETTRRNSKKNQKRNHTGHVCYSKDEFDFIMISCVNVLKNRDKIKDCNKWFFFLIPIYEIIDKDKNCCVSQINPSILKKYIIEINNNKIHNLFN